VAAGGNKKPKVKIRIKKINQATKRKGHERRRVVREEKRDGRLGGKEKNGLS